MSAYRAARGYGEIDAQSASFESELQFLGRRSTAGRAEEAGEIDDNWLSVAKDETTDPSCTADARH